MKKWTPLTTQTQNHKKQQASVSTILQASLSGTLPPNSAMIGYGQLKGHWLQATEGALVMGNWRGIGYGQLKVHWLRATEGALVTGNWRGTGYGQL